MENQAHVILVTQTRVKPDKQDQFGKWQGKLSQVLEKFPGYVTQKISAPNPPVQQDWIIMQYFVSSDRAKAWLQSKGRQELLDEISSLTLGFDDIYLIDLDSAPKNQHPVTATIATKIKPEKESEFKNWHSRISSVESKFPGFIGSRIEAPRPGIHDTWITILTFDSNEHLETWLTSDSRKKLVNELNSFSEEVTLRKMYPGFDIWFDQGNIKPSVLKANMLIFLTLYPVVFLYSIYVQPYLMPKDAPFWFVLFIGNAISTIILGWLTVPLLVKLFSWWLKPTNEISSTHNILGFLLVLFLYLLLMFLFSLIH